MRARDDTDDAPAPDPPTLIVGRLTIDRVQREARIDGYRLRLRKKVFELLRALAEQGTGYASREYLLDVVWGYRQPVETRTLDAHISDLRAELAGTGVSIETKRRVGYRIVMSDK